VPSAIPVGHLLFFAVGAWPPHAGVRKAKRPNLSRDLRYVRRMSIVRDDRRPSPRVALAPIASAFLIVSFFGFGGGLFGLAELRLNVAVGSAKRTPQYHQPVSILIWAECRWHRRLRWRQAQGCLTGSDRARRLPADSLDGRPRSGCAMPGVCTYAASAKRSRRHFCDSSRPACRNWHQIASAVSAG
jgi:hypothetical protein